MWRRSFKSGDGDEDDGDDEDLCQPDDFIPIQRVQKTQMDDVVHQDTSRGSCGESAEHRQPDIERTHRLHTSWDYSVWGQRGD